MRWVIPLFALVALAGCTGRDPAAAPSVTIDTSSLCGGDPDTCINAGATTHDVSGVHVIHKRVKGDPVVAVRVLFDGGDRGGRELWSEDMALEMLGLGGPKDLTLSGWQTAVSTVGANVSASMGTGYGAVFAVAPVTYWADLWRLLSGALASPANDDYLLSYLRGWISHRYDAELDEAQSAVSVTAWSGLFEGHVYDRFRASQADAQRVAVEDVNEAWAGMLTKERLWVVVVGDVERADVDQKVAQAFGRLPSRHMSGFAPPPAPPPPPSASRAAVLDYPDARSWQIVGNFLGPDATDPDYPALAIAMKLLDRRLFAEVREARGLAYSVGASLGFGRPSIGTLSVATDVPSDALPVVRQTISNLIETPVSGDELAAAVSLVRSALLSSNRTPSQIASTLGRYQLIAGDRLAVESFLGELSAVAPEGARQALARYLRAVSLGAAGAGGGLDETSLLAILPQGMADGGL